MQKFAVVLLGFTLTLTVSSSLFARDYSYMDDHPSVTTRSSSSPDSPSTGTNSALNTVLHAAVGATMDSVFSHEEKEVIRRYFRDYDYSNRRNAERDSDAGRRYSGDYDDGTYAKKHKKSKNKHHKKKTLPPGLRKKLARGGELPPGWQKKVQRGEVMNAELYLRTRPLPSKLHRTLPHWEYGAEVREIEGMVVKILAASGAIIDVFEL